MRRFRFIVLVVLIGFFNGDVFSQISISTIKNAGINSEQDLKNLGVSSAQIEKAKQQFFSSEGSSEPKSNSSGEVDEEKKKEEVKEITVPKLNLVSNKEEGDNEIYGHSIFSNGSVNIIENSDRIKAPENYRLVAGDKINITIWGYSEFSGEFIVGESGNITPKLVGRINLKGKTFSTARKIVTSRFGRVYDLKNSQIAIDLSYSQVISVNVIGEVKKPGSYSIPSLNSAFNVLALASGPSDLGSIRSIEIRRNGELEQIMDIYNFMFEPKSFKNQYLQDGDFIVVPPKQGIIQIDGEVKRPGKYEYKEGDKFSDLLKFCGGYSAMANTSSINITRVNNNQLQMFSIGELLAGQKDFLLKNGDVVNVLRVSDLIRNSISIKGAVHVPGYYPLKKGTKISDLIVSAKGLTYKAFTKLGHVYRLKEDLSYEVRTFDLGKIMSSPNDTSNLMLKEFDQVIVFDKEAFIRKTSVSISGMINLPGTFKYNAGMTLEDLVLLSNGANTEADLSKIEIERISYQEIDSNGTYVKVINLNYPEDKLMLLNPFDKVHFRKLTGFHYQQTIEIKGEVKYPGTYSLTGHLNHISDMIKRAGGVTAWAYLENSSIERVEFNLGLILLDLKKVISNENSRFNYILKQGDVITIPRRNDIVTIKGAIGFKFINGESEVINTPFHKGKRAGYYVRKYGGGYDKNAKRNRVYVVSSNGLVKKGTFFGWIKPKVNKGDKVLVHYKKEKIKRDKGEKIDWNNVIENTTIKITGLATLWVLLEKINL